MSEDKNKFQNHRNSEVGEDATKYGEFISSFFSWIPLPKQKENANRLEDITKNKDKNKQ